MTHHKKPYFDPDAPGFRGFIGLTLLVFAIIGKYIMSHLRSGWMIFMRLHPRIRGLVAIMTAVLLLLVVVYLVLSLISGEGEPTLIPLPSVAEALEPPYGLLNQSPFDLETDFSQIMPAKIGDYQLTAEAGDLATGPLTLCIVDSSNPCQLAYQPYVAYQFRYTNQDNDVMDVVIANYYNSDTTSAAIYALMQSARSYGRVSNFVLGRNTLNYFYSSSQGWFSFTWSNDLWVLSINSTETQIVEDAVKSLVR